MNACATRRGYLASRSPTPISTDASQAGVVVLVAELADNFLGFVAARGVSCGTHAHVIEHDDLVRRGLGGSSIRHRLASLASLFEYLCEWNAATHNPAKGVERPRTESGEGKTPALGDHQTRKRPVAPEADTVKSKRDRAILSTLLFHALRRRELCKLKVKERAAPPGKACPISRYPAKVAAEVCGTSSRRLDAGGAYRHAERGTGPDGVHPVKPSPFRFHGWLGKRLTASFGWNYDFDTARFAPTEPIPDWLCPLRKRAAQFACLEPNDLVQALLIRYDPRAGIGWHRDRPVFERMGLAPAINLPSMPRRPCRCQPGRQDRPPNTTELRNTRRNTGSTSASTEAWMFLSP